MCCVRIEFDVQTIDVVLFTDGCCDHFGSRSVNHDSICLHFLSIGSFEDGSINGDLFFHAALASERDVLMRCSWSAGNQSLGFLPIRNPILVLNASRAMHGGTHTSL